MKIKISILDEGNKEVDWITREVPYYQQYDFVKGILIDLSLIFGRNREVFDVYGWLIALIEKYIES